MSKDTNIIQMSGFKSQKQRQFYKKYRTRMDSFIRSRIPQDWASELLQHIEAYQHNHSDLETVWDYSDARDVLLEFVSDEVAKDVYDSLKEQYWFDHKLVPLEAVAERCLSFMILGPAAAQSL
jgi:hypothetical protein